MEAVRLPYKAGGRGKKVGEESVKRKKKIRNREAKRS